MTELPVALDALKDWSAWLVSIQTAVLALAAFTVGKDGFLVVSNSRLVRGLLALASLALLFSIICATFVLGAIPSIALRLEEMPNNDNFYQMPIAGAPVFESIYNWLPESGQLLLRLWTFTVAEHLFFLIGIVLFVGALLVSLWKKGSNPQDSAVTKERLAE